MITKKTKTKPLTDEQIELLWISVSEKFADEFSDPNDT